MGNFTGLIGDTSDKDSERPMLDAGTVERNMESYFEQAGKILDMDSVERRLNADWLGNLGYLEIGEQADAFSVHEFVSRENIRKRLDVGKRVSLREVLYPLMQGYDSVAVSADVEIGGTDQRFNLLAGRMLQSRYGQDPQDVLMTNLIEGTDGRKMSSSWGNTIDLSDGQNDMFGKVMSIPDTLIATYLVHVTRIPMEEIAAMEAGMKDGSVNPRDAKIRLAREIVRMYHGESSSTDAEEYFVTAVSKRETPQDIPEISVSGEGEGILDFIVRSGNATSKADARRKIGQGGVSVAGEPIDDWSLVLDRTTYDGTVVKIGKTGFVRLRFS